MSEQTTAQKNEVKLSVMSEKITNIERDIGEIKNSVTDMVNRLDHNYVTKIELVPLQDKVRELEDNNRWLVRVVAGAIILTVLGAIGLKQF